MIIVKKVETIQTNLTALRFKIHEEAIVLVIINENTLPLSVGEEAGGEARKDTLIIVIMTNSATYNNRYCWLY